MNIAFTTKPTVLAPNGTEDIGFTNKDVKSDNTGVANDIAMVRGDQTSTTRHRTIYSVSHNTRAIGELCYLKKIQKL